jgi:hypothetical protein
MSNLPQMKFGSCPVLVTEEGVYYVWTLSDETKAKIRNLLSAQDLKFGFNNTLEKVPPFSCPECGIEITFFDQVRTALSRGLHSPERLTHWLQQKVLLGPGAVHHITCENGHEQPIVLGWAQNFGWSQG